MTKLLDRNRRAAADPTRKSTDVVRRSISYSLQVQNLDDAEPDLDLSGAFNQMVMTCNDRVFDYLVELACERRWLGLGGLSRVGIREM